MNPQRGYILLRETDPKHPRWFIDHSHKVHKGPRGAKYIWHKGQKIYLSRLEKIRGTARTYQRKP